MVKNDKTLFSKLTQKISQLTRGKEARRQASKWISPLRQILFILLVSYFNDVCCTFHLGKMFIRFLSIIFHIYCSLVPQLSCITVRLSGGHVSFISCQRLVSVKNKLLYSVLWRPVSLSFSFLIALEGYDSQELLFQEKMGSE